MSEIISMEQKRKILKERAKALASRGKDEKAGGERIAVVEFGLAGERYAVESRYVREVLPFRKLALIPCTPSFVLGVIDVRGEILSVIDLGVFFELPRAAATPGAKIIVLESTEMELGIAADVVAGARSIPLEEVSEAPPTLTGVREAYLRGLAEEDLVILDAARLLADKSIQVNDEVGP